MSAAEPRPFTTHTIPNDPQTLQAELCAAQARVAELEAQCRQARADSAAAAALAATARRAKTDFLSRMSHELRTPLNAVIGFAQLLRLDPQQPLSSTQRSKIEQIERAGAHLLGLVHDVLDLAHLETGDLPLSPAPVPLHAALVEAGDQIKHTAMQAGIELSHLGQPDDIRLCVQADPLRLRQILANLLSNAIKYNRPGGRVTTRCWTDGAQIAIEVSDTGRGMSAAQCAHLFELFNRLGAENTGIEGSGIGLVIVRRLAELMGGRIEVDSELGVGSRFVVWLPSADMPSHLQANAARHEDADMAEGDAGALMPSPPHVVGAAPIAPTEAHTVLYAEDNDVNVALIRQVMALRPACRLIVAGSGAEAIELVRRQRPDLLLLDMHLGDMSGFDVAQALERDPATAGIPRIALSADAMPATVEQARAQGFAAYLTKPLDVMALLRGLDEHLGRQHHHRAD